MFEIKVDERQLATILAALRLWQDKRLNRGPDMAALREIATDAGQFEGLTADEIEALCEEINLGEEATVGRAKPPAGGSDDDPTPKMRRYLVTGDTESTFLFEAWHKEKLEDLKKLKFARGIHERRAFDDTHATTYMTIDSPFPDATERAMVRVAGRTGVTLERLLGAGPAERYETLHLASHGKTWAGRPKKGRRT